jgi:hypothetical protein
MDYLKFKGVDWPVRVSYYALKQYQNETKKGIETLEEDLSNLEIILHYAIVAGCKAENKEFTLTRADMELILDESMQEFNSILIGSFQQSKGVDDSKKK